MLNHCLVIGRNTAGTKEQFDNGLRITNEEIGIRFNDTHNLQSVLEDIDSISDNQYQHITNLAYRVASQSYSAESNAESIYKFYTECLAIHNPS